MPNINKNIIMQAGAAVANATNKAAGLSASTPEPGTIISAIQIVNGGRTIGPAALAHFAESVRNKLLSLLVNMKPIQDLNGYDRPWPAGGGKNKCAQDLQNGQIGSNGGYSSNTGRVTNAVLINGLYLSNTYLPAGTYTISITDLTQCTIITKDSSGNTIDNFAGSWHNLPYTFTMTAEGYVLFTGRKSAGNLNPDDYKAQIESGSTASSWEPYENICPITGRTGANAYVSPNPNVADATTYIADWTTPAGTVYAGSADIVTGDINAAPYYASYNGETLVGPWVSSMDAYDPEGTPTTGAQVVDLGGTMTEYHITGQDIITLVGDNYIWSDSGDVTITE